MQESIDSAARLAGLDPRTIHYYPGDKKIREMVVKYLHSHHRKELRRMRQEGALDGFCALTAQNVLRYADRRIRQGTIPDYAFSLAYRTQIFERDED